MRYGAVIRRKSRKLPLTEILLPAPQGSPRRPGRWFYIVFRFAVLGVLISTVRLLIQIFIYGKVLAVEHNSLILIIEFGLLGGLIAWQILEVLSIDKFI